MLGGWDGSKKTDSLLIHNNEKNDGSWKELNIKLPYAMRFHGAQFLNNYLYIFGGINKEDEVLNASHKLTGGHKWLNNNFKWVKVTDMNQKRKNISNSSVILSGQIWVMGGCNEEDGELKSVEMYDPKTNVWTNMQ